MMPCPTGTAVSQKKGDKKAPFKTIIDVKQMIHDTIHDPNQPSLIGCDEKLLKPLAMFANRFDLFAHRLAN